MIALSSIPFSVASLSVYGDLKKDTVISGLVQLLSAENKTPEQLAGIWGDMLKPLIENSPTCSLPDYIYEKVLYSENSFASACSKGNSTGIDITLKSAAEHDLKVLSSIAYLSSQQLKEHLEANRQVEAGFIDQLPDYNHLHFQYACSPCWEDDSERFAEFYYYNGTGVFAKYKAFKFSVVNNTYLMNKQNSLSELNFYKNALIPIADPDAVSVCSLKGYEAPRKQVEDNTRAFVKGLPANNILLYGDRGTGKSSTVKAMLSLFGDLGLRIIEVTKENLLYLDKLSEIAAEQPLKFLVFIDDLSFNEDDSSISGLKAVLEGTLAKRPANLLIYATSNRRHLIKESFSSRTGDDVHLSDTLQETLSLSDRFGLTITFELPGKDSFLHIVSELAKESAIELDEDQLHLGAERWAMLHGGRSPRMAKQFINSLLSKECTSKHKNYPEDI